MIDFCPCPIFGEILLGKFPISHDVVVYIPLSTYDISVESHTPGGLGITDLAVGDAQLILASAHILTAPPMY